LEDADSRLVRKHIQASPRDHRALERDAQPARATFQKSSSHHNVRRYQITLVSSLRSTLPTGPRGYSRHLRSPGWPQGQPMTRGLRASSARWTGQPQQPSPCFRSRAQEQVNIRAFAGSKCVANLCVQKIRRAPYRTATSESELLSSCLDILPV
jgi:hypothetical protein